MNRPNALTARLRGGKSTACTRLRPVAPQFLQEPPRTCAYGLRHVAAAIFLRGAFAVWGPCFLWLRLPPSLARVWSVVDCVGLNR